MRTSGAAALGAGVGAISAAVAHWLYGFEQWWLTALVSAAVLAPGLSLLWLMQREFTWRRAVWLAVALPFPYTLVVMLYASRTGWLPESLQPYLNSPTAYLLVVCGGLAVSLA